MKILTIIGIYIGLMMINYIKVYGPSTFDKDTGKWKWYINLPNIKINDNEVVKEYEYKRYLYLVLNAIFTIYFIVYLMIEIFWEWNTINSLLLIIFMIIDIFYFMLIRNKRQFIDKNKKPL